MASDWLIAAALAAGGVGLYFVLKPKKKPASACDQLCTSAGDPGGHAVCVAACNVGGGVLGDVAGLFHTGRPNSQVLADEAAENDKLNGPIKTPTHKLDPKPTQLGAARQIAPQDLGMKLLLSLDPPEALPFGLGGNAIEYENGCVPFWGAEGWSKCAQGTHNMFGEENRDLNEQVDMTEPWRFVTTRPARRSPNDPVQQPVFVRDFHTIRQGSFDRIRPDPTTQGPVPAAGGGNTWLIAGELLTCPAGQCPDTVDSTHFAYPPKCVRDGKYTNEGNVAGTGDCPNPGFTWDVAKDGTRFVRRLRVGETKVVCKSQLPGGTSAPATTSFAVLGTVHAFP